MQERPDQTTTLMAISQFLAADVRPAIADKALRFRVLVASAVVASLAIESHGAEERQVDELQSLLRLAEQGPADGAATAARKRALRQRNTELADELRTADITPERWADLGEHLRSTIAAQVAAINPRFDLRNDIEGTS